MHLVAKISKNHEAATPWTKYLSTTPVHKLVDKYCFLFVSLRQTEYTMKRIFKKTWIGVVALATLIVGACCSNKNTGDQKMSKKELKERIAELRAIVEEREMSCVYGSPEIIAEYGRETGRLRAELDSLQKELDNYGKCK